jgi:hypothetical protein
MDNLQRMRNAIGLFSVIPLVLGLLVISPAFGQGPVAHYTFDNSPADVSGNHNDGVIHGTVKAVMDRFGNPCGAYQFDGLSGYIEVPSSPSLERPAGALTITTWYRFPSKRPNYWLTAICKGNTADERDDNPQYRLQIQQNFVSGNAACVAGTQQGSSTLSMKTGCTPCDQQYQDHLLQPFEWSFCAMVYDGQQLKVYLNDKKVFEMPYNKPLIKNKEPLYIGYDEPGLTEYFDGALDDLYIYDRALTDQEVAGLFAEQRAASWDKREFEVSAPRNKVVQIPSGNIEVSVSYDKPTLSYQSCGQVTMEQIAGPPSGALLKEGKYLVVYKVASTTGYTENKGFYLFVRKQPDVPVSTPAPPPKTIASVPPPAPKPVPAMAQQPIPAVVQPPPAPVRKSYTPQGSPKTYLPADLKTRESIDVKVVEVVADTLKVMLYDDGDFDGDTVSLFLNGRNILAHQLVTPTGTPFYFTIDSTKDNELLFYAENLGKIPPNTALLIFEDDGIRYSIRVSTTMKQNGIIRIRKKKK